MAIIADKLTVYPGKICGTVAAPASKSFMQRVCAAAWVKGGQTTIMNPGKADDDRAVLRLLQSAGCTINLDHAGRLVIDAIPAADHKLHLADFAESGLAARMCIPILALAGHNVQLTAAPSLRRRPMGFFEQFLPLLGVSVTLDEGHLPGSISGRLIPRDLTVDGSLSSQFVTGLLLAYAGASANDVAITVRDAVSNGYISLTLDVMGRMGLPVPQRKGDTFYFEGGPPTDGDVTISIEGDWSGAAFLLVAGAVAGSVTVQQLDAFSEQGDKAIVQTLMECGARLSIEAEQVSAAKMPLKAFYAIATDTPDLFPPLAALACCIDGTSVIEGVGRLRHKESDRAATICSELGKMGADVSIQDDLMIIKGTGVLQVAAVDAHGDHRIAMMCAVAALSATGPVTISGAASVSKSYPRFFDDLRGLGAKIEAAE